ncbi:TetR/AcrR family transcriptional regulator [Paenibacillus soyae]|uniref:TetR/AcrR family transcriptional regulator n=1 Tax=Paenibacillus soyae TaxID=2969249 RepID=A0A9X2MUA8_9BACL|nr:TetR/AcrR family transcriptional regulator [Paenibacillus soyae]MCR2806625.1 TetR/AcrR family transcriptional regulator [Paenibacillus soyae]
MPSGPYNGEEDDFGSLPGGVKLSWGIVKKPKRGPKGELSIPQIVEAAMGIADEEGLAAVSMSKVAQKLGFTPMSLYRYVSSKEELIQLMQDAACDIRVPSLREEVGWREEMREFFEESVRVFREHPWYADIQITSIPLTPNILRMIDWMMRIMRNFPLNDFEKMSFVLLLSSYARACGLIERDMIGVMRSGKTMEEFGGIQFTAALKKLVKQEQFPYLYPVLMSGAYTGEVESPIGDDLAFGLERILDSIEQYVETRRAMQSGN